MAALVRRAFPVILLTMMVGCGGSPWGGIDNQQGGSGGPSSGSGSGSGSRSDNPSGSGSGFGSGGSGSSSSPSPSSSSSSSSPPPSSSGTKHVFVTRTQYTGALGGLAGADSRCQISADAAGLGGSWKAWLSDSSLAAPSRITGGGPWRLVGSDQLVFASAASLRGYPSNPLDRDEYGKQTTNGIWTGTLDQGFAASDTCADWTEGDWNAHGVSGFPQMPSEWTSDGATYGCDIENALLCIEQ